MILTNEEKAKVFAMYTNHPVHGGNPFTQLGTMQGILLNRSICVGTCGLNGSIPNWIKIQHCYLALTPLSDITDEHAIEVAKIRGGLFNYDESELNNESAIAYYRENMIEYGVKTVNFLTETNLLHAINNSIFIYQYLISKGYDVPLWHGLNHPLNGKTAIDIGIAIDKTTSNTWVK